ncbi:SCO2521 family protein [Dactylosporangium roseum]|nr:SCO2521 family protein [Dactylosporangium roseum]
MLESPSAGAFLVLGEVHTALLQSSAALPVNACERLVRLIGGERIRRFERPIVHVASPSVLTGVDCRLATRDGAKVRAIGTVESRVAITGGHLLQASSRVCLEPSAARRRLPWSHYLTRPGRAEVIAKRLDAEDLAQSFVQGELRADHDDTVLDLASVTTRLVDEVQQSSALDRRAPLRAGRTKLRWAAVVAEGAVRGPSLVVESGGVRTLVVQCRAVDVDTIGDFSDDVALHDWLLTTLLHVIESSRMGNDDHAKVMARLRPAVEHLLHLWMPEARLSRDEVGAQLWRSLENRPGMSRQWRSCVDRIRDQLALNTIALFGERVGEASR